MATGLDPRGIEQSHRLAANGATIARGFQPQRRRDSPAKHTSRVLTCFGQGCYNVT